jgi:hypothetical protein
MKKVVMVMVVAALSAGTVHAQDGSFGVGYQGLISNEFISAASIRAWLSEKVGVEGFVGYWDVDNTGDAFVLGAQGLYALIVRQNSKMYVGLEGAFGQANQDGGADTDIWWLRPLFGAQYSFQGLPELGFQWDVGYAFGNADAGNGNDADVSGVLVTVGVNYYVN